MKRPRINGWRGLVVVCLCAGGTVLAQSPVKSESERLRELEELVQLLRQQNLSLQQRVGDLERDKAKPAETLPDPQPAARGTVISNQLPVANQPGATSAGASSADVARSLNAPLGPDQPLGRQSPVVDRGAFEDEQVSAPRPGDLTLDPKYRGFFPVPHTPVLLKINAKPRVDFISDSQNAGDPSRFRPGQFPTEGSPGYGGGSEFNVSAQGSRLMLDVRAPEKRFYYENDFFGGSGDAMSLRFATSTGRSITWSLVRPGPRLWIRTRFLTRWIIRGLTRRSWLARRCFATSSR